MFTGLIKDIGRVTEQHRQGENIVLSVATKKLIDQIQIGDSVAISGVCLTVVKVGQHSDSFTVTAVAETVNRTTLGRLQIGDCVNLETSLKVGDTLGGHFVQGHVDAVGVCEGIEARSGSWVLRFRHPEEFAPLVVEKGSIAVDGVSLTSFNCRPDRFAVSIVPHTWTETTLSRLGVGDQVNLEFDIIGKYVLNYRQKSASAGLTPEKLAQFGY